MLNLKEHIPEKKNKILNSTVIFYTLLAAILLCAMSFVQKIIAGYNPFVLKAYYIPLIFGSVAGFLIGSYLKKLKLTAIVLQENILIQHMMMENLPAGIIIVDPGTRVIEDVNKAAALMYGSHKEAIIGHQCHSYICPAEKGLCPICDLNQEIDNSEREMICSDGSRRPILKSVKRIQIQGKDKLLECFIDITEIKKTKKSLIESEKQFQDLFNSITDLIYTQDLQGHFITVNPATHRIFGYDKDDFLGRKIAEFMEPDRQSGLTTRYLDVIRQQGHHEGKGCYLTKTGEKIYLEYKSSLVKPDDGEPYISGMARDVTEKIISEKKVKNLQEQVAQSQKMEAIGTLAGGIAHDFNNILFPIMGHTQMLMKDVDENSSIKTSLDKIYAGAIRASDLVRQILTFSRQESNQLKPMKIQPVIKEVLKLIRSTIPTTIEIKSDIQADCNSIKADPTQIHQIIMNLTTNAYHAMEEIGGELNVNLKQVELSESDIVSSDMVSGKYACLTITDTGNGMDKELTQKIFDPFFTTKERGKGTGMGLSVVHGIVTGMQGKIMVDSEPGKGTKFHVYMPIAKTIEKQQRTNTEESIQGGTEHIFLVDDEKDIIEMEKEVLERLGYKVTSCSSSLETLEIFRAAPDRFDLVITDMQMPNMSGDKLSAELTKICPDIPILLCTGFSNIMSEEKATSLGINGFLLKPIVMKDLSRKIRDVLDKK